MARDASTGAVEQKLLLQVLEQGIPLEQVKSWLDDAFQGASVEARDPTSHKYGTFEKYDAVTFVVIVLNFLREDASPLLTPTTALQEGAPEGVLAGSHKKGGDVSSAKRGQLPPSAFDIASADDFPSLAMGEAPRAPRWVNKQKRRIRPTPLTDSEKPSEGDITVFGGSAPSAFSTTNDAPAKGRLQVRPRRTELLQQSQPLETAPRQRNLAFTGDQANVASLGVPFTGSGSHIGAGVRLTPKAAKGHAGVEEGRGEDESGISHLRELTSGSTPKPTRFAQRGDVVPSGDGAGVKEGVRNHGKTASSLLFAMESTAVDGGGSNGIRARLLAADGAQRKRYPVGGSVTMGFSNNERPSSGQMAADLSPFTPTKQSTIASTTRPGGDVSTPVMTPTAPITRTAEEQKGRQGQEPPLAIMASLYVHIMIRRFVPSLATEMHLTVRLLHVHPDVVRASSTAIHGRSPSLGQDLQLQPSSSGSVPPSPAVVAGQGDEDDCARVQPPEENSIFKNGLDCRSFAACVLLGLKSLLPHLGTDTLDLLAGSLAVASESEEVIDEVRHVLCQARDDGVKAIGSGGRSLGQQNADDTAIVQSVGAPFAALQWREEDSVNNFRTTSDRSLFQNRQESVDRFGSLLRDYQGSKKGLQQYPERALQDLRTAASMLIGALAPENFGWLAQYFLAQLVGWGLAPPEETDSEVMALVAPAGDKGRATLQKLHRRISTPSVGEDGNAAKSSQKLRHPGTQPRQAHANQDRALNGVGDARLPKAAGQQLRPRKVGAGPRQSKGQTPPVTARVPTAPLQLRWFPGNQDFFYHVLLALDSYTFNSHLKAELVAEIARLYYEQTTSKTRGVSDYKDGPSGASDDSNSTVAGGVRGFTGTMVKLKVLAKFLGLLTFCPNWGIPVSDAASNLHEGPSLYTDKKAYATCCPLPLETYLDHAWSTKGLVGVVPWVADFLRMMKWDDISAQTAFYKHALGTLASIHAQPCMRPDHAAFNECLLAVSCEIETLFQDLGSDLGVHGYRMFSVASMPTSFGFLRQGNALGSTQQDSGGDQKSSFSTRTYPKPQSGSLDAEVVLSRRLIQNCCPYLEDVLTLIGSLGRAWKLRLSNGDGNLVRSISGRSPRAVGATGVSPRSRRVIKPHPLKPLLVLPSLLEHHQRVKGVSGDSGTEPGNAQTESARLRLVEAFFHSLPGELQVSADFVVRRAVQNACEEVLAAVIKPAVAAVISRLVVSLKEDDRTGLTPKLASLTGNAFPLGSSRGVHIISRQRLDQRIAWAISSVEESVGSKARSLAGRKGYAIAKATTLSLVPHSLPLRVRQTAAAIAGHHAQETAKRKIEEVATTTVTEAVVACHEGMEKTKEDVSQVGLSRQHSIRPHSADGMDREVGQDGLPCPPVLLQGIPITPQASQLPALVSSLCGAYCIGHPSRQEDLLKAAQRAAESNTDDMQAVVSVLSGTLHLVQVVRCRLESRSAPRDLNDAHNGEVSGDGLDCRMGNREELQTTGPLPIRDHGERQTSNTLQLFLSLLAEVWGCLYRTCPNQQSVVQALRHTFSSTSTPGQAFEDLVHLAAIAWKETSMSDSEAETLCAERCTPTHSSDGRLVGGQSAISTRERHSRCPPWAAALELMSWGVLPAVTAENVLLSCVQAVAKVPQCGKDEAQTVCAAAKSSKNAVIAVITAIAKGYHSLAVGEDLSAVLLADLLDVAARSLTKNAVVRVSYYHSMNLCRLVGRLVAM